MSALSSLLPIEIGGGKHDQEQRAEPFLRAMNQRMKQPESRTSYARRKTIAEPVFGQIKNAGFRGFGLRAKARVAGEFSLECAAHSLKKIIPAAVLGEVCPAFVKRVTLTCMRGR
ncbi:MAG: transposase [Acidobacteriota bacterium]|nr:transposase [Acidobacteriota bacterium]